MTDGAHRYVHSFGNYFVFRPVCHESGQKENSAKGDRYDRQKLNCPAPLGSIERIYMHLHSFYKRFTITSLSIRTFNTQSNFFMKHLKKSFTLLMLLTSINGSPVFAQDYFKFASADGLMRQIRSKERAKEVIQENEYAITGYEVGIFLSNPLLLNGKPLDYGEFNLGSKGELTVIKAADMTGQTIQIPFYVYLRRNGNKLLIPGRERSDPKQVKIDISEILRHAEPGDHLVIEAVRKENGPVKRILKLLGGGC